MELQRMTTRSVEGLPAPSQSQELSPLDAILAKWDAQRVVWTTPPVVEVQTPILDMILDSSPLLSEIAALRRMGARGRTQSPKNVALQDALLRNAFLLMRKASEQDKAKEEAATKRRLPCKVCLANGASLAEALECSWARDV